MITQMRACGYISHAHYNIVIQESQPNLIHGIHLPPAY